MVTNENQRTEWIAENLNATAKRRKYTVCNLQNKMGNLQNKKLKSKNSIMTSTIKETREVEEKVEKKKVFLGLQTVLLVVFLFSTMVLSLSAQNVTRIKIVRVATVDVGQLLKVIKSNASIERNLYVKKSEDLIRISNLEEEIAELNSYLEENKDSLSLERQKEITDDLILKKNQINALGFSMGSRKTEDGKIASQAIRGLYQLIKKEAQVQGFSMIIEKSSGVLYVDEDLDLTETLREKLLSMGSVGKNRFE